MVKKVVYVDPETHKKLMLLKISAKARDLDQVIRELLEEIKGEKGGEYP